MLSFIKPADPNETSSLVSPSMSSSGHKYSSNTQNSQCIQFKYICFKKTNLCTWKGSLWLILCIDFCYMCLIQAWRCFKIIWKTTYVNNWFPSRTFLIHPPAAPILKNQSTWYNVFNSSVVLFFFFAYDWILKCIMFSEPWTTGWGFQGSRRLGKLLLGLGAWPVFSKEKSWGKFSDVWTEC